MLCCDEDRLLPRDLAQRWACSSVEARLTITVHHAQEVNPRTPIKEPALSQVLRRFTSLRAVNPDEWPLPLRCEDATLPALLVRPPEKFRANRVHGSMRQPYCSRSGSRAALQRRRPYGFDVRNTNVPVGYAALPVPGVSVHMCSRD